MFVHLNLWRIPKQSRPQSENKFTLPIHNPNQAIAGQEKFFDDGWPGYDEPVVLIAAFFSGSVLAVLFPSLGRSRKMRLLISFSGH